MRIRYDPEVDALSVIFRETTVTTKELADGIVAEHDAQDRLVGIEILDAMLIATLGNDDYGLSTTDSRPSTACNGASTADSRASTAGNEPNSGSNASNSGNNGTNSGSNGISSGSSGTCDGASDRPIQ